MMKNYSGFKTAYGAILTAVCLLLPSLGWGQAQVLTSGGYAMPLSNLGPSARANVMGSAFVGVADDSSAVFWNPAGLGFQEDGEIAFHHNSWLTDITEETAVMSLPMEYGTLGVAVDFVNYGSFEGRDSTGAQTSSYTGNNIAGALGWGSELMDQYFAGLTLKYSQMTLSSQAVSVFSGELGLMKQIGKNFRLGLSYNNLGTAVNGNQLDGALNVGGSYHVRLAKQSRVIVALGAQVGTNSVNQIQLAAEDVMYSVVALRAGYQLNLSDMQLEGLTGLSAGVGFTVQDFVVDYAYLPYGDLGTSNRVSVSYLF